MQADLAPIQRKSGVESLIVLLNFLAPIRPLVEVDPINDSKVRRKIEIRTIFAKSTPVLLTEMEFDAPKGTVLLSLTKNSISSFLRMLLSNPTGYSLCQLRRFEILQGNFF